MIYPIDSTESLSCAFAIKLSTMKLSCVACRQKKIKCDRNQPCQHCSRAGVKCVPQTRAKVTRRLKKPADTQVLERLKQLESIVSRLEGDNSSSSQSPPDPSPQHTQTGPSSTSSIADTFGPESFADGQQPPQPPVGEGRLVVKDGKTTYVTGGFWANLTNEVGLRLRSSSLSSSKARIL